MKKIVILLAVLAICCLLLCACGKDGGKGNEGNDLPSFETVDEANAIDLSNYVIIRSDTGSKKEKDAAIALRAAIKEKCRVNPDMKTDFGGGGSGLEIVVGNTKRGGADHLGKAQYVIEHSEKGFLIAGGSETATVAAVNFFIDNLLSPSGALCKAHFKYEVDNSPVFGDKTYDEVKVFVGFIGDMCSAKIVEKYEGLGVPATICEDEKDANIILTSDADFKISSVQKDNWGVTVENGVLYVVGRDEYDVASVCNYISEYFENVKGKTVFGNGILKMDKKLSKEEFYKEKNLTIYPEFPELIGRDYMYSVSVTQGDKTSTLPVYNHCQDNPHWTRDNTGNDKYRRFSLFAFSGEQVRVDVKVGCDFESYSVMPSAKGLKSEFKDGVISVYLDKPEYFVIRLDNDNNSLLSILVDYPEYPLDIPSKNDPDVIWISGVQEAEKGVTELSENNQTLYVEPGAVFFSRVKITGENCKVLGRGAIVDPYENFYKFNSAGQSETKGTMMIQMLGKNGLFDGPVLLDAHTYNFHIRNGGTVRNGKALSVMITSDGLQVTEGSAERCYVYVGDNGTVFQKTTSYKDITIGTTCGAIFPQNEITSAVLEDIYVFRADEGVINNYYNGDETERTANVTITGLYADDCGSLPYLFKGKNMGRLEKIFNLTNVTVCPTTGVVGAYAKNKTNALILFDTVEGALFTDNYTLNIKNLYVNGKLIKNADELNVITSGTGAANQINISSDNTEIITAKKYQANYKNDLNIFIGALRVFTENPAVEEGGKIYVPTEEIKVLLRAKGNVETVDKNGIAYVDINNLVKAGLASGAEKSGNVVVLTPVAKMGDLLLPDSGDIPYYTEATAYSVDMTAKVIDDETVYSVFNIVAAGAGIKRDLTNEVKMYGNGKYVLKFDISGNGNARVKTYLDTDNATVTTYNQSAFLNGTWKTISVELDIDADLNAVKCYSFSVAAEDTGLTSFEIKNIIFKKIG